MANSFAVSILVPICNVQRYLRQCLDSLISQTLRELQIICIDDGSTDSSPEIIEEFRRVDPRIEVISKPNSGYGDSMNKGLDLARGEYIGIVESDDFASPEMFERLFRLAKDNDADVVKSNFYAHAEGNFSKDDELVDNLGEGPYNKVFCPLEHQDVFLWRPAIWSGLYKASFLRDNNIRFLPTPGASFQDTSFNFKVFAAAKRAYLTKEAFLHYRIDNVNSSVKSQKKVFCICDEYREIWQFVKERHLDSSSLFTLIPFIQYGGYRWNLDRLTPGLQPTFYQTFVDEFQTLSERHALQKDRFNDASWNDLASMLADPDLYFQSNYGPLQIDTTYLLLFPGKATPNEQTILSFADEIGNNDELLCAANDASELKQAIEKARACNKRIHCIEEALDSSSSYLLSLDHVRGERIRIYVVQNETIDLNSLRNELSKINGTSNMPYSSSVMIEYPKGYLASLNVPLFLPLLANGFYLLTEKENLGPIKSLPDSWVPAYAEKLDSKAHLTSRTAFEAIIDWTNSIFPTDDFETRMIVLQKIDPLWRAIRDDYQSLDYSERLKIKTAPSAERLQPALKSSKNGTQSNPNVSVIIPIYNAENYLRDCLDSILNQTQAGLEVVCVIDGSNDKSLSILENYITRFQSMVIAYQVNLGAGGARNRGIALAHGSRLSFIDPDDYYPDSKSLELLFNAAEQNDADICGGSFSTILPNGTVTDCFFGRQAFYTFHKEGFRTFELDQDDYGWIRFMYGKAFLTKNNIKFPDMRWYEDPVFFTSAISFAEKYYVIPHVVYRYREEFKPANWTVEKARDILKGIAANLRFALNGNYRRLYSLLVQRLDEDYYEALIKNIEDPEVFARLIEIQTSLEPSMISSVCEASESYHLLKTLADLKDQKIGNTAIVRVARKVSESAPYKSLQAIREKFGD